MQKLNNRGYTMLDMLLTVMLLSVLTTLTLNKNVTPKEDALNFVAEYNYIHATSFLENGSEMENEYSEYPIRFNENSVVNMGQTFTIGNNEVVIRPITGYIRVE